MKIKKNLEHLISTNKNYHPADRNLIIIIFAILIFGLISLSSASAVVAYTQRNDAYYYLKHQLFGLVFGLAAFWFFAKVDYRVWKKYAFGFLIFSIFLLILVFIPGIRAGWGTARSWIDVFGYSLQPSEFVKLSFLLYLAAWLEVRKNKLEDWHKGIGPFVVILGIIALLMVLQPDIGTLGIIGAIALLVYFVAGGKISHIATIIIAGALCLSVMIYWKPYQFNRFRCMFDPNFSRNEVLLPSQSITYCRWLWWFLGQGIGAKPAKIYVCTRGER